VNAKSQIQASSLSDTSGLSPSGLDGWGLQTENTSDTNAGYDLGFSADGAYALYRNVDFGSGVASVNARLACNQNGGGNCGGALEFRIDSPTGTLVGSVVIPATSGWQTWSTVNSTVSGASGLHDLYVIFRAPAGSRTGLGNLNWFQFN
jgi:hypothetical protein